MNERKLTTLSADASNEERLSVIERDGGVIIQDCLAPDLFHQLNAELDHYIETHPPGSRSDEQLWQDFHGQQTIRFCGLAAKSKAFVVITFYPIAARTGPIPPKP